MKSIFSYTLCISFVIALITSCSKSKKEELANTWRVSSYSEVTTYDDGSTSTISAADSPGNPNELIISSDGTWVWNKKSTYTTTIFGGSLLLTIRTTKTQNGTWSRVKKTGESTQHEHVLFNTLFESTITNQTGGGNIFPDITTTDSKTYPEGEQRIIYKFTSLNKELQFESENIQPSTSWEQRNIQFTLVKKE